MTTGMVALSEGLALSLSVSPTTYNSSGLGWPGSFHIVHTMPTELPAGHSHGWVARPPSPHIHKGYVFARLPATFSPPEASQR